jgi:hypothetical protein
MSLRRCLSCKRWVGCPGFDWYEPREIVFCFPQVIFLIFHADILEIGEYPPDPTPTGYSALGGKPQFRSGGNFIAAAGLFAEIDWRLRRADGDGDTLRHEVQKLGVTNYLALSRAARNALSYVAGWKRKPAKYGRWLANRAYYRALRAAKV